MFGVVKTVFSALKALPGITGVGNMIKWGSEIKPVSASLAAVGGAAVGGFTGDQLSKAYENQEKTATSIDLGIAGALGVVGLVASWPVALGCTAAGMAFSFTGCHEKVAKWGMSLFADEDGKKLLAQTNELAEKLKNGEKIVSENATMSVSSVLQVETVGAAAAGMPKLHNVSVENDVQTNIRYLMQNVDNFKHDYVDTHMQKGADGKMHFKADDLDQHFALKKVMLQQIDIVETQMREKGVNEDGLEGIVHSMREAVSVMRFGTDELNRILSPAETPASAASLQRNNEIGA